ncbi:MAG TPA: response regulator [Alphaproteobacteria bacterium]|nr:response regulator [Alphaproteobacteria bacterium]
MAKVLIVEDDALEAMGMHAVLTTAGFEVVGVAPRVSDAVRLAKDTSPDVAIFDVRLAGQRDGIEGACILRETAGTAVIFVTGQSDAATIARATQAEPVAVLQKPVWTKHLLTAVETAATRHRQETREWPES